MNEVQKLVARAQETRDEPLPEGRIETMAERVLKLAPAIGISGPDEALLVLDLWLALAAEGPAPLYAQGLLRVVLSSRAWPLTARVAFLRRHLLGRAITQEDEAEARALFGVGA